MPARGRAARPVRLLRGLAGCAGEIRRELAPCPPDRRSHQLRARSAAVVEVRVTAVPGGGNPSASLAIRPARRRRFILPRTSRGFPPGRSIHGPFGISGIFSGAAHCGYRRFVTS
jgi:hypothetical protein